MEVAPSVKVAVVKSDNRRGATAQALTLLDEDLRRVVRPQVLVKPNLVSHRSQLPSTHVDVLSATLDALLDAGARQVLIAEGATDATAGFHRFGYRPETWGRPVHFLDINRDERDWDTVDLFALDGTPHAARLSRTVADSDCRVSLALAKTHVTSMVTFSLKNMLSSLHPSDRVMMHGHRGGGNGCSGWKKHVVEFLKSDNAAVRLLTRSIGRLRGLKSLLRGDDRFESLTAKDLAFLRTVEAMNRNLVALTRRVKPHLAVVDGFVGMHREGPRHGSPFPLGVVIAGTDAVAVDAVAAALMGFDPLAIGYLKDAQAAGLGVADLGAIEVVGDPLAKVRRRCVPHSNYRVQRHWPRLREVASPGLRGPHVRPAGTPAR